MLEVIHKLSYHYLNRPRRTPILCGVRNANKHFETLKKTLVDAPMLIWLDFNKQFCLDVDWSPKGVGVILS
jgi:hypothetical protein